MRSKLSVTIKGSPEGLIFLFDEKCDFALLIKDLTLKLNKYEQQFSGPLMHVYIKIGTRKLTEEQEEQIRFIFSCHPNLVVQSIKRSYESLSSKLKKKAVYPMIGIVRSGQVVEHAGDLLFLGDVNGGGEVRCTGDVYILGVLRGTVSAGLNGDRNAIIAASSLMPTQLNIAGIVSCPPEKWEKKQVAIEYAFVEDDRIMIANLCNLARQTKEVMLGKGAK